MVAEGCGDTLLKSSGERLEPRKAEFRGWQGDAGGNMKLADVGPWLRDQILAYAKRRNHALCLRNSFMPWCRLWLEDRGRSVMAGHAQLVDQVKTLQRADPIGRAAWWDYCENHLGGVKDPNRHDESTLSTFLGLYQSGGLPPSEPRPEMFKGSGKGKGKGWDHGWDQGWGGGWGNDMMMMGGGMGGYAPGLGDFVKTGQRQSKHWTNAWQIYCALYGGGLNDPNKHEDSFIKSFVEYVGEIAANGLSALAAQQGINLEEVTASNKRPYDKGYEKGYEKGGYGEKGGGGPPMPAKQARLDYDSSSEKQSLVEKVKHLQRTSYQAKEAWWSYCDNQCSGMRDPMRHDCASLEAWLASQGTS